jgi:hypothetical protein
MICLELNPITGGAIMQQPNVLEFITGLLNDICYKQGVYGISNLLLWQAVLPYNIKLDVDADGYLFGLSYNLDGKDDIYIEIEHVNLGDINA